jgi:hypothetical protein
MLATHAHAVEGKTAEGLPELDFRQAHCPAEAAGTDKGFRGRAHDAERSSR